MNTNDPLSPTEQLAQIELNRIAEREERIKNNKETAKTVISIVAIGIVGVVATLVIFGGIHSTYLMLNNIDLKPHIEYRTNVIYAPYFVPFTNMQQFRQP